MADNLTIIENGGGGTYMSFRAAATNLLLDTWRSAPAGDGKVIETFRVAFTGTDAVVRANVELLLRYRQRIRDYYSNPVVTSAIMLQMYSDSEPTKWALIYEMSAMPVEEGTWTPMLGRGIVVYQIAILRDEGWEDETPIIITSNNISCTGGKQAVNNSGAYYGSLNGRIKSMAVYDGPAVDLYRLWIGIQPYLWTNGYAEINASFDASWEAEVGTAVLGSFVNDATASPAGTSSNCLEVTTVPATLDKAWWSRLLDHSGSNWFLYPGDWYVLARIKLNAGTVAVQLRSGVGSSSTDPLAVGKTNEIVYVSNTGWRLIDLGKITLPVYGNTGSGTPSMPYSSLSVYIQQISGTTASFKLDEIILIPARHFVKAYKARVDASVGTTFFVRDDGKVDCLYSDESGRAEATFSGWEWPYQGGFIVAAGEAETAHTLTDTVDLYLTINKKILGHAT